MLPDELTLLDGTEVISLSAVPYLTGLDYWLTHDLVTRRLTPATVLDGVRYFSRADVIELIAGAR